MVPKNPNIKKVFVDVVLLMFFDKTFTIIRTIKKKIALL